jgi:hypothetical protein
MLVGRGQNMELFQGDIKVHCSSSQVNYSPIFDSEGFASRKTYVKCKFSR